MRALRRFTVRAQLPGQLAPLGELVLNLRWSWHPETLDLFESVDPELWRATKGDPVRLLGEVDHNRLLALAADRRFVRRLTDVADDLQEYLTADLWYQQRKAEGAPSAIAYFSPEFGITEVLPQYSGGLGILAGDHLKTASDLGVPIIGVGLLYRAGYFVQSLSRDGWQQERYPGIDPHGLPLTQLTDTAGMPVKVAVGLPEGRTLHAQIWKAQVGRVPLLLLDSDVEDNQPAERGVTDRLYGGGTDHRLLQEMLLGIGGVRALRAYAAVTGTPEPEVYHTNEGHAGFLGLERIRELVENGLSFDEALQAARAGTLFTTHTPVPAGIDRFPRSLVARHFGGDNGWPGVPVERIMQLGVEADPNVFNMAHMGLRLAQRSNGVSKLHGIVSREMFAGLWPGFDTAEVPIGSVTNGVHAPTWVSRPIIELADREPDPGLLSDDAAGFEKISTLPDEVVWAARRQLRERLVTEVRRRLRASWLERGAAPGELEWVESVFDPDILTIGFARRVPSYKRLTLMLRDRDRLRRLLLHPQRPIQMVIAGKAHPADDGGKQLVQQIVQFSDDPAVRSRIVFLPDYDIGMARFLYSGSDVWLNNPLRPLEACGTSGMKAALNGCLNLSIRDGWWDEMFDGQNGWAIPTADGVEDPDRRDDIESAALYDLLENTVAPRFYDSEPGDGIPRRWAAMVKHTLSALGPQVLASRMVQEYVERYYVPAGVSARAAAANGFAGARDLAAWKSRVHAAWPGVRVLNVDSAGLGDTPQVGQSLVVRATVDLGELALGDIDVLASYGRIDQTDRILDPSTLFLQPVGEGEGGYRYEGTIPLGRTGPFGYTVRVLPRHALTASIAELGLVTNP
ncbi:glucan phosphorylase [Frankia casuarinae]|uniref:glycogen phosphorylase n=1 Tax=Frankia casuarinae (strain DSM 45818 / CECT 9043 / HFP020203 / CcI3) TaxID=106370 RepID=Q2J6S6_FRACC|nr:alpha-glucan family phosphorylase [Frankia casuarinae]ABD13016.1 Alpha-glucan phosphorylase [Frankia casuarinae]EYT92476.1 glucan phosphorylase [Frankia casuarinae]